MSSEAQPPFVTREDLKSPAVLLFAAVYLLAAGAALIMRTPQIVLYIGLSLGVLFLIWLIVALSRNFQLEEIGVREPVVELYFAVLIYLCSCYVPLPRFEFGKDWWLSSILRNELFFFLAPLAFLLLRRYSAPAMGLSLQNLVQNLKIGGLVLVCMAIPSLLFLSNTAELILSKRIPVSRAVPAFLILFGHDVVLAGFPEEFFFRGFVQTRIGKAVRSNLGGVLLTAILFGLVHISSIQRRAPEISLPEAFVQTFFIQGIFSLVVGVLWARTQSLIPGILVHSGINALSNLERAVNLLYS